MKKILCLMALSLVTMVAGAGEKFKWTGAASAIWTNAANWQVWDSSKSEYVAATRCPGNNVVDCLGDECIFGAIGKDCSTNVDVTLTKYGAAGTEYAKYDNSVTNIYLIHFVEGAPSYCFKGPALKKFATVSNRQDWACYHFENGGGITIDEDVTNSQHFTASIGTMYRALPGMGTDENIYINLNASDVTLNLNGFVNDTSGLNGYIYVTGSGNINWGGVSNGDWGPSGFYIQNTGTARFPSPSNGLQPKRWHFYNCEKVTIPSGCYSLMSKDGSPSVADGVTFYDDLTVDGGGKLLMRSHSVNVDVYGLQVKNNKTVTLDVVLASSDDTSTEIARSAYLNGAGTFVLCSSNTFSGMLMLGGGVTVKAAKFGDTVLTSNIGTGDKILYRGNGTLEYTGAETTFARTLILTNTANIVAGVRNSGTGALTLNSTIVTRKDEATLKLGGSESAPIVFGCSFADESFGDVTLLVDGVLDLSNIAALPAKITKVKFAAGDNKLILPTSPTDNEFTIPGWTAPSAGTNLNLVVGSGITVKLGGVTTAALLPANVTFNGERAKVSAEGVITSAQVYWSSAQDGNWKDGANWNPAAVPTAYDVVFVDATGNDYTVTVDDDSSSAATIIKVGTGNDDYTATVALEKNVALDASRDIKVVKGGKVTVGGTGDEAKELKWTANNSAMIHHGGKLDFSGDSSLTLTNDYTSSYVRFGTGEVTFRDSARINSDFSTGGHVFLTPDAENETSTLNFKDGSYFISWSNQSALFIGRDVPDGATGVCNHQMSNMLVSTSRDTDARHPKGAGLTSWYVGCANEGKRGNGVLNLKNGRITYSNLGLHLGTGVGVNAVVSADSGTVVTGILNHTGGLVSGCSYMPGYVNDSISGLIIGSGVKFGTGNSVYGQYNFKNGQIWSSGFMMVGVGPSAYGELNIGDADNPDASMYAEFGSDWQQGSSEHYGIYHNPVVVGFAKGKGLINVFGSAASVYFRNGICVGGTDIKGLRINEKGTSTRPDYTDAACGSGTKESVGELRVSAGSVQAYYNASGHYDWKNAYFGADGKGTLAMSGKGSFTCYDLVLSNSTESVAKFTLPVNGVPRWTLCATNAIYITDGATLTIDASAVEGMVSPKITKLADSHLAVVGEFASGKYVVVGDNAAARQLREATILYTNPKNADEHGIFIQRPKFGSVILLR